MSLPYLYGGGAPPNAAAAGTLALPAGGGFVAIPFGVPGQVVIQSGAIRTTDVSGTHSIEVAVYAEREDRFVRLGLPNLFTFTATAAAVRAAALGQPVICGPGCVWLVIRNAGTIPVTLSTIAAGALGGNLVLTGTAAALPEEVDPAAVSLVPVAALPLVRLDCSTLIRQGRTL